jgi:NAD(P)-dependent dehydrogenase (short-subunit alcohol dehydrogenase family)
LPRATAGGSGNWFGGTGLAGIKLELVERLALGYQFHIASSREQAIREAAPNDEENMKMSGELRLVRALTDEQIAAMHDPRLAGTVKLPTIEDAVKAGGFLAGRPQDIIEALKAVEKRYPGLDCVICATPLGTPLDVRLADLDRFAKEVIPPSATPGPPPRSRARISRRAPRSSARQRRRRVASPNIVRWAERRLRAVSGR